MCRIVRASVVLYLYGIFLIISIALLVNEIDFDCCLLPSTTFIMVS